MRHLETGAAHSTSVLLRTSLRSTFIHTELVPCKKKKKAVCSRSLADKPWSYRASTREDLEPFEELDPCQRRCALRCFSKTPFPSILPFSPQVILSGDYSVHFLLWIGMTMIHTSSKALGSETRHRLFLTGKQIIGPD